MTYEPPATPHPDPTMGRALPPTRRGIGRGWKIGLIIAGVLLLLCCIGGILVGIFGVKLFQEATGPAKDSAVSYLDDVQAGNYGSAYDKLCDSAKRQVTQQEFAQAQSLLPKITKHEVTGVNINTTNGKTTGSVTVKLTRDMVGEVNQTIALVKEDGKWKVCQAGI